MAYSLARAGFCDRQVFAALARRSMETCSEFTAHDAAALCWACSAAGVVERELFESLAAQIDQPSSNGSSSLCRLSPPLAAELAWGLAAAGAPAGPHVSVAFATLEDICLSNMEILETEDVAGFAWAFAVAGRKNASLFRAIAVYAERYAGRLRPGEIHILAWALGEAGQSAGARFRDKVLRVTGGS
eukprot:TRINITY_DN63445_c0_g1_i1.p1 TRINITY_DN63445_c0_g1~~TRINITY_DN63445_c0_g1_i1.p1  ORF type:complete len:219 (+),score=47.68 TRINITY_DN63445_c0_g1_i1:98-658(+)